MIGHLFGIYRKSPFWLRRLIGASTWPLRVAMFPFRTLRLDGYRMRLDFLDNASFKYFADRGSYEAEEMGALLEVVARIPDAVVLDVGANYGAVTLAAANLASRGGAHTIVAIEPDPRPVRALRASVALNGFESRVTVVQAIASDEDGEETLFVNARSSADNRTGVVTTAPIAVRSTQRVEAVRIDTLLDRLGIDRRRRFVIKMDIQGNEPRALAGMRRLLTECAGFVLFFEHCRYLIESAQCDYPAYLEALAELSCDEFYRIEDGQGLRRLEGMAGLLAEFDELDREHETRMQGAAGDFVVARGMNSPAQVRGSSRA